MSKGLTRQAFAKYFGYIVLQLSYPDIPYAALPRTGSIICRAWSAFALRVPNRLALSSRLAVALNAADYGVPQKRERVFFVGFRSDIEVPWSFPAPAHSKQALLHFNGSRASIGSDTEFQSVRGLLLQHTSTLLKKLSLISVAPEAGCRGSRFVTRSPTSVSLLAIRAAFCSPTTFSKRGQNRIRDTRAAPSMSPQKP